MSLYRVSLHPCSISDADIEGSLAELMEIAEMKRWLILAAALMLAAGGSLLVEPVIAQCSFSSRRPRKDVR